MSMSINEMAAMRADIAAMKRLEEDKLAANTAHVMAMLQHHTDNQIPLVHANIDTKRNDYYLINGAIIPVPKLVVNRVWESGAITNGKNILLWNELDMDEPGGVIRITLADLMSQYGVDLDILLGDDNELLRLADWRADSVTYKDCCVYNRQFVYRAHNGRTKPFRIKYYLDSKNTRMYMVTRDPSHIYVTGLVYDMEGNAIDDIDLS